MNLMYKRMSRGTVEGVYIVLEILCRGVVDECDIECFFPFDF